MMRRLLIKNAEVNGAVASDVRVAEGVVREIGCLSRQSGEPMISANGGALLPGLHDHHIHLMSTAAAQDSVPCGPPKVHTKNQLIEILQRHSKSSTNWLRGIGYHESIAGNIDRYWLDGFVPHQPVRIQHASGRLWVLNSVAMELLTGSFPAGVEIENGQPTGRIYDSDQWLREHYTHAPPDISGLSHDLCSCGITGVTDMTPENDDDTVDLFMKKVAAGELQQRIHIAGGADMSYPFSSPFVGVGPLKVHLHEHELPDFDDLVESINQVHRRQRPAAMHCVTQTELVFALSAFQEAGTIPGDRIEHASVTSDECLRQISQLRLTVVTQPNFVRERGDRYLREVPQSDHPLLYRCASFLNAGIRLAGGTDAPFGEVDPWALMAAAVERKTQKGRSLSPHEALTPEEALRLFMGSAEKPGIARRIHPGARADLCLLSTPWRVARDALCRENVRMTIIDGEIVYSDKAEEIIKASSQCRQPIPIRAPALS